MRNFKEYEIWKLGMEIVKEVYLVTEFLPDTEKYGLKSQMQRAAVSIPSNIAEGCSRNSELEFKRFLEIAMGSSFELETQLLLSEQLGFVKSDVLGNCINMISRFQKQTNSLINKIKESF